MPVTVPTKFKAGVVTPHVCHWWCQARDPTSPGVTLADDGCVDPAGSRRVGLSFPVQNCRESLLRPVQGGRVFNLVKLVQAKVDATARDSSYEQAVSFFKRVIILWGRALSCAPSRHGARNISVRERSPRTRGGTCDPCG